MRVSERERCAKALSPVETGGDVLHDAHQLMSRGMSDTKIVLLNRINLSSN